MPKKFKEFDARLDFLVPKKMKLDLISIAYMMGAGGEHSTPARNFLRRPIKAYIEGLSDKERGEFNQIRANVEIRFSDE